MTLTVKLDEQEQTRLDALIVALNLNDRSKLIRKLINERFAQLQVEKTLLERRGAHPQHLLQGESNLSSRDVRKSDVAKKIQAKSLRRQGK